MHTRWLGPLLLLSLSGCAAGIQNSSQSNSNGSADTGSSANTDNSLQGSVDASQGSADATAGSGASSGAGAEASTRSSSDSTIASSRQTTGPLLSTATVGTTIGGVGLLIWSLQAAAAAPAAAQAFLRSHERQLRQDLALGAGPAIEDLAEAARIRPGNLSRFGRLLRQNREELLALVEPGTRNPERAVEALQRIGAIVRADEAIAADYRAFKGQVE